MKNIRIYSFLLSLLLAISACSLPVISPPGNEEATATSNVSVHEYTATPIALSETNASATITVAASTQAPPTATAIPSGIGTCINSASLVEDVTVPDDMQFDPGNSFTKTWRLKNTGTCTWDSRYQLVFAGGNHIGSLSDRFALDVTVAPGELVDLSVALVAPTETNTYQGDWKLQSPQGQLFGVGSNNGPFWVRIKVQAGADESISGVVFQDADQNGKYDSGEVLLGSQEVRLIPGESCPLIQNAVAVAFSNDKGRYSFSGNYDGSYCVVLVEVKDVHDVANLTVTEGQKLSNINLRSPVAGSSITGYLWNDYCLIDEKGNALEGDCVMDGSGNYHADGMIQPMEAYISNVTVLLRLGSCKDENAVPVSTVTDVSGKYVFRNLQPGTYCVLIESASPQNGSILQPGVWTFPSVEIGFQEITLSTNDGAYPVNFGWDFQLK